MDNRGFLRHFIKTPQSLLGGNKIVIDIDKEITTEILINQRVRWSAFYHHFYKSYINDFIRE